MKALNLFALTAGWLARLLALLLFLFWGAFFVEHLREWFFNNGHGFPPSRVWIGQFLHLVMILGLATIILRPNLGAVVTVVGTVSFFSWIGYRGFPYIALLNLLPIVFVLVSLILRKSQMAETGVPPKGDPTPPLGQSVGNEDPPAAS